jgi:hypothetical protein
VSQKHQNVIRIIATTTGVLSLFWGLFIAFYSFVDPVGPMFSIFAIPFVLLSLVLGYKGWLILKLYGTLFVLSWCVAYWTAHNIEGKAAEVKSLKPFNEDIFIKCSNTMFKNMKENQNQLTLQQQADFDKCMNQE